MDPIFIILAVVVGFVIGFGIVFALQKQRIASIQTETENLRAENKGLLEEKGKSNLQASRITDLEAKISDLQTQNTELSSGMTKIAAELRAEQDKVQESRAFIEKAQQELVKAFDSAAATSSEKQMKQFLHLANENFESLRKQSAGDLEQRKEAIEHLIKPVKEHLEHFSKQVNELEQKREGAYASLSEQVKALYESQSKLQTETSKLVRSLRNPAQRGRWGEIQLQRVVEIAGLQEKVDFETQETFAGDSGNLRPDMVVRLPNSSRIVVDSKAPIESYLDAYDSDDDDVRAELLANHARLVREHVKKLASKKYWESAEAIEFVILFLPLESAYSAAINTDPSLIEFAAENRVILSNPTTLIALLKAVAYGWKNEQIASEAREIHSLGNQLYESLKVLAKHYSSLGKHLDHAVESYNSTITSLESRVLVRARRFGKIVNPAEEIAELEPVNSRTKAIRQPELMSDRLSDELGLIEAIPDLADPESL